MRKITQLLIFLPAIAFAQNTDVLKQKANRVDFNTRTNAPAFVELKSNQNLKITNAESDQWARQLFQLREQDKFKFVEKYDDKFKADVSHYKYQQQYNNIPVEFTMIRVREKGGNIQSVNGDFYLSFEPENNIVISSTQAFENAKAAVPATKYKWEMKEEEAMLRVALAKPDFSYDPKVQLVLLPLDKGAGRKLYYAYKFDIYAHEPDVRFDVYVDASNGEVLKKLPKLCTIDVPGKAQTKYYGLQNITTDSIAPGQYILRQNNRKGVAQQIETRDCNNNDENASVDFTDADNLWNNVNSSYNEAATDCHLGAEMTFDYFYDTLNRDSYDGQGSKLLQYMHFDRGWFNAQWTGSYSRYGDGNGEPLVSVDVVSHEITHGVTQTTAGLIYESQSGALNESFSDIFGTAVEFGKLGPGLASWIIGKNSFALRNMAAPNDFQNPDTYEGLYWTNTKDCVPSGNNDYCGVHNNSGVQNFWFYLLAQGGVGNNDKNTAYNVSGIGLHKAARIAYKNLRDYLTFESNYEDARNGSIQAAIDLYGFGSQEYQSTMNAWHAVGVGRAYTAIPVADFFVEEVICKANTAISFKNNSGSATSYLWDFGDGATSNQTNPSHSYSANGIYNVRLIATNPNGSDTFLKNNCVYIFSNSVIPTSCVADVQLPLGTTGIYKVKLAELENSSFGPTAEDPYMDFTCYRAFVGAGNSYPMEITTFVTSAVFTRVHIDWNNDGTYDASELVMKTDAVVQNHYDTVFVPRSAVKDVPLRMRVVSGRASINTPDVICSKVRNGQIEDYTVIVSSSIGIDQSKNYQFNIYPNPSNGIFNIKGINASSDVRVLNIIGAELMKINIQEDQAIDLSSLAKGVYLLEINSNGMIETQKIIIQ